jgi:hypothetical protein
MLAKVLQTPESKRLKPETVCETTFKVKVTVVKECRCTSENLHYEVRWPDGSVSVLHHNELIPDIN